jgi:hypothetical protein
LPATIDAFGRDAARASTRDFKRMATHTTATWAAQAQRIPAPAWPGWIGLVTMPFAP